MDLRGPSLIPVIRSSLLGGASSFEGPFGRRTVLYMDYTASSRSLGFLEDFIAREVLPFYSNTHTTSSRCGNQTSFYREESRRIIADSVKATDDDVVLFCGSGSTAAILKLIQLLGLQPRSTHSSSFHCDFPNCQMSFPDSAYLKLHQRTHNDGDRATLSTPISLDSLPSPVPALSSSSLPETVVFLSVMEHHSNVLTWREYADEVVVIPLLPSGALDMAFLQSKLEEFRDCPRLIASFTAASNITGLVLPRQEISSLLTPYHVIQCWDFANGFSHLPCVMDAQTDALFISPHKMIGGPQTSGVLVLKRNLIRTYRPSVPAGGTIFFVASSHHWYTQRIEEREEGGTPGIVQDIRTGLVFQLRDRITPSLIEARESALITRAMERLRTTPNVVILGDSALPRVSILSFMVRFQDRFLHWNFVCALLNDLFGIQTRGGCMCSGPYAIHLLGIRDDCLRLLELELLNQREIFRPGFTRLSFPFFMSEEEFQYSLDAIEFVGRFGYLFVPQYSFVVETSEWIHRKYYFKAPYRRWLSGLRLDESGLHGLTADPSLKFNRESASSLLSEAHALKDRLESEYRSSTSSLDPMNLAVIFDSVPAVLRWFAILSDVLQFVKEGAIPPLSEVLLHLSSRDFRVVLPKANHAVANECSLAPSTKLVDLTAYESKGFEVMVRESFDGSKSDLVEYTVHVPGLPTSERFLRMKTQPELYPRPSKRLFQWIGRAIHDHQMIQANDRLLLGLSGGKDSLTLLLALLYIQKRSPVPFSVSAVTVDPQTSGFDPSPLIDYCYSLGVEYFFESQGIVNRAKVSMNQHQSICAWCSRMKRGALYSTCRQNHFNVLVLAQHLDDLAESFLMSVFHNGLMRTMKANYSIRTKDIRVIRPLIYARESATRQFAKISRLPVIFENCPACFEGPRERHRIKTLLAAQEQLFPDVLQNLLSAMQPLVSVRTAGSDADAEDEED